MFFESLKMEVSTIFDVWYSGLKRQLFTDMWESVGEYKSGKIFDFVLFYSKVFTAST